MRLGMVMCLEVGYLNLFSGTFYILEADVPRARYDRYAIKREILLTVEQRWALERGEFLDLPVRKGVLLTPQELASYVAVFNGRNSTVRCVRSW